MASHASSASGATPPSTSAAVNASAKRRTTGIRSRRSSSTTAEYVAVRNGVITYSRFIFDRAPFEAARRAAADSRA